MKSFMGMKACNQNKIEPNGNLMYKQFLCLDFVQGLYKPGMIL